MKVHDGTVRQGYLLSPPWGLRESEDDVYMMEADRVRRPLLPFRDELINAVKEFSALYHGETIHLFYSGGVDSEGLAEACRIAGVPYKLIIFRDTGGANEWELHSARDYIVRMHLSNYELHEFNFLDWLRSVESQTLGSQAQASLASVTLLYKPMLTTFKDKVMMLGYDSPNAIQRDSKKWYITNSELYYSLFKFFNQHKLMGSTGFFSWSTELYHSWFEEPVIKKYAVDGLLYDDIIHGERMLEVGRCKQEFWMSTFGLPHRTKIQWQGLTQPWHSYHIKCTSHFFAPLDQWLKDHL